MIINGKIYIAPGMFLINKETGKPITEEQYLRWKNDNQTKL